MVMYRWVILEMGLYRSQLTVTLILCCSLNYYYSHGYCRSRYSMVYFAMCVNTQRLVHGQMFQLRPTVCSPNDLSVRVVRCTAPIEIQHSPNALRWPLSAAQYDLTTNKIQPFFETDRFRKGINENF